MKGMEILYAYNCIMVKKVIVVCCAYPCPIDLVLYMKYG